MKLLHGTKCAFGAVRSPRSVCKTLMASGICALMLYTVHCATSSERALVLGKLIHDDQKADVTLKQELKEYERGATGSVSEGRLGGNAKHKSPDLVCPSNIVHPLGKLQAQELEVEPKMLAAFLSVLLEQGGHFKPPMCQPVEKTAIIIPYRNRRSNLYTLLPILIPLLVRQRVEFTIYVVEQNNPSTFNKGLLFNAGVLEALKIDDYECFIFHDVDLIPLDDRNMYMCNKTSPIHFTGAIDNYVGAKYGGLFGGVVGFTREQFEKINGASNMYFGWGGEDDDLRDRAANKNYVLIRKDPNVAVYYAASHGHGASGGGWVRNPDRFKVFSKRLERQDIDGLNSARYTRTALTKGPLYTLINISLNEKEVLESVPEHLRKGKKPDHGFDKPIIKSNDMVL